VGASEKPDHRWRQPARRRLYGRHVLALNYAKAYQIDRPALTVNPQVEQIGPTEVTATSWSCSRLKTTGVGPYDLTLKD
jgi:hypothetical protein